MSGFLLRVIVNAVILFFVTVEFSGVFVDTLGSTLAGAAVIGFVNAAIRPLLMLAQLPFSWPTLGAFTLFTNFLTPLMVVKTLPGFQIHSLITAVGSLVLLSLCSCTLSRIVKDR